jgi:hypothetical protein
MQLEWNCNGNVGLQLESRKSGGGQGTVMVVSGIQGCLNGLQTTCKHCQKAEKPNAFSEENKTKTIIN